MATIRVLVVEDSATIRGLLSVALATDPDIEVVAQAADGEQAIMLCEQLRPDVITMDMMLPVMSGLAATEYVMARCPTPILIVSASVNRGELFKTYDALAAGAVDVMEKPRGDETDAHWQQQFLSRVKLVSRIRVITHPRPGRMAGGRNLGPVAQTRRFRSVQERPPAIVAVGASTGGPGAIVEVLRGLKPELSLPVLVLLHLGAPFGAAFADWLDSQTTRPVALAVDGQPLDELSGQVVVAPPDRHLIVQDHRLRLISGAERHSCRPSIDVLFESLAVELGSGTMACLLTGMGRDGAAGLAAIRRRGGTTIAQDEATSVVYGMPREAVLLDAADHVLPLGEIGPALSALADAAVSVVP